MESRPPLAPGPGSRAGFVLTGGASSRMGRDKAALPFAGATLVEHVAACVRRAASSVTLIGAPGRYAALAIPSLADRYPNCGPLGGLCTALETTSADWNLIVACDMPGVTADFLAQLLAAAEAPATDCVIPETADGLHPLCAVYHRRTAHAGRLQILRKSFKMHDFVATLQAVRFPASPAFLENVNSPLDWIAR